MKQLFFCACALFAFGAASAQSESIKFGVKAGFVHTNLVGDDFADGEGDDYDFGSKIGGYIGGLVDIPVSGNFHVQPELLFVAEGADELGLVYARIPVLGKYYIMQGLALQAGPTFGVLIGAENNAEDFLKRGDVALTGGATYEFDFGLFADARFNAGLIDITDGPGEIRTASFMLGAGYRF